MSIDLILKILLVIIMIRVLIVDTKRLRAEIKTQETIDKLKAEFDEKTKDLEMQDNSINNGQSNDKICE